ncbi:hypothetical protein K7432_001580 [Basidiobolus ranarum]|uniref:C2H2-type domain-containing protein n=1 Tax=Basidiobolus ranarum TaxID=34480 RepID=A0ABR2X2T7_9FUNG
MLDQPLSQTNDFPFTTAHLPVDSDHLSFGSLIQEQSDLSDFISTSILEAPRLTMISTAPTPDFEICPATPLNETPETQSLSDGVSFTRDNHFHQRQQNHLEPRATHRARSSSISSLSSITSSTSSFEEVWDLESENTLINMNMVDVGINMDDFNLGSSQSVSGSPSMSSPQDQPFVGPYFTNQNDFVLSQNGYLSPNTQLSRSSSLSSNPSQSSYSGSVSESYVQNNEYFQELLSSQLLASRRSSMCSIGTPTSFIDPDFCTQEELSEIQHGHGRSYSMSTIDFPSYNDNFQYPPFDQAKPLTGEANYPKLDLSQEMLPTVCDRSLQLSQEEIQFITFNSDLQNINSSTLCEANCANVGSQSCSSNRGQTEYICTISGCSKTFRRKHSLLSHQRTHSDDKPFPCEFCSRPFARKHDMLRHRRMHTGQKPYPCEACGMGFYRTDARQRHYQAEPKCWEVVMKGKIGM